MGLRSPTVINLIEYTPVRLARSTFAETVGATIWKTFGRHVTVEFPSVKTDDCWQLTAQGWVGMLPVATDLTLLLQPKVDLRTLWSMLAYAFDLRDLHFRNELVAAATLPDLYEHLALIFAQRVLERRRQGILHKYQPTTERGIAVRGRVQPAESLRRPWDVALTCQYEVFTADIEENQLLLWTLDRILRGRLCSAPVQRTVMRAFHTLQPDVDLRPFSATACRQRRYDRLSEDYRPLHALCYFFLAQTAPFPAAGDALMLPFSIHMATLYERFVGAWLQRNLGRAWRLTAQEHYRLGSTGDLAFRVDLVVRERATGLVRWVLDTKYRVQQAPSTDDVTQVLAYAQAAGASEAILIYPSPLPRPVDVTVGGVRIRSLVFDLQTTNVERAGQAFLSALLHPLPAERAGAAQPTSQSTSKSVNQSIHPQPGDPHELF